MGRTTLLGAGKPGSAWYAGYSASVQQFFARIAEPSSGDKTAYSTLIDGLVTDSVWPKLDALYILAAPDSATALINLKSSSYNLTLVGAPTFTANRGYVGGAGKALDTGFVPDPATGGVLQSNDNHIGTYCLTSRTTGQAYIQMGSSDSVSGAGLHIFPKHTDNNTYYANQDVDNSHALSANASGHYINTRTTSTLVTLWRNGASFNTDTGTSGSDYPDLSLYILALHTTAPVLLPSSDEISAAHIGAGLNSTLAGNISTRVNAFMTTKTINTY